MFTLTIFKARRIIISTLSAGDLNAVQREYILKAFGDVISDFVDDVTFKQMQVGYMFNYLSSFSYIVHNGVKLFGVG